MSIRDILWQMRPGQQIVLDRHVAAEVFRCGWPSIYRTTREAILSSLPGSYWGAYTCEERIEDGAYVIRRYEQGTKRIYIDPDREHLFQRLPDGSYEPLPKDKGKA